MFHSACTSRSARIHLVAGMLALLFLPAPPAQGQPYSDDELIDRGIEAYNELDFENALSYLFAYRMRQPTPQLLVDHPDFDREVETAVEVSIERLRSRLDKIADLEQQVLELGGAIVRGFTIAPPPLERPGPGDDEGPPDEARGERPVIDGVDVGVRDDLGGAARDAVEEIDAGRVDAGAVQDVDEDCVVFDPEALRLTRAGGRHVLADGRHYVFSFPNAREAEQALAVVRRHDFRRLCFVGRPDPSLMYMLR